MQRKKQTLLKLLIATSLIVVAVIVFLIAPVSGWVNPLSGNITYVERVGFPVVIEEDQIQPGELWTFVYYLEGGHKYHIYLVGEWVNLDDHLTDYDVQVFRARSSVLNFISSHTESAGYPEQISNDDKGWYFTPDQSGSYYLCIRNDPNDSQKAESATLMVIEAIDPDIYYKVKMEEPSDSHIVPDSSYAFEFITDQPRMTVDISVPNSLDMYEARLYLMANLEDEVGDEIDGLITPWSPGLLGQLKEEYGGYNDDPQGYRNYDASDSCERNGEDMYIDYNSTRNDPILYFLVLIAENGEGRVNFVLRTDYSPPNITLINPPSFITSDETFTLRSNITDISEIVQVDFYTSTDDKQTWENMDYSLSDGIYSVKMPALKKGTICDYYWEATDVLGNTAKEYGQAKAMNPTEIILVVEPENIYGGDGVISRGTIGLPYADITLNYTRGDDVVRFDITADDGNFTHLFLPNQVGEWQVTAEFVGDSVNWPSTSNTTFFTMRRKPTTLNLNISRDWIGLGDYVNVTGQFSEQRVGYEVFITARQGLNQTSLFALTDENGSYSTTFYPEGMGEWTLYAEVAADGIYIDSAVSLPDRFSVGDPTLVYRLNNFRQNMFKTPYVYGGGAFLGASIGGGLVLARRRGFLRNPFNRGEIVEEEPVDLDVDEEDDFEF